MLVLRRHSGWIITSDYHARRAGGSGERVHAEDRDVLRDLLRGQRWAALATVREDGAPYVSFVAYVAEADYASYLLHLSTLAPHTRYLLAGGGASLGITLPDAGHGDPQLLPRVTLSGAVETLARETPDYAAARALYLQRLPEAERLFGFGDFVLFRLRVQEARYVGGFARAVTLNAETLRRLLESC